MIYDKLPTNSPHDETNDLAETSVAAEQVAVLEGAPRRLDIEYNPDSLIAITPEQVERIYKMADAMRDAKEDQKAIEFAIYHELEGLGIDLSTVHDGFVPVEAVYGDGVREPRAMNISASDFGTMLRNVTLHEQTADHNEYALNQDELIDSLIENISEESRDLIKRIDIELTQVPPRMVADYQDAAMTLLNNLYRGTVQGHEMQDFFDRTLQIKSRFTAEQQTRHDRQQKVVPGMILEHIPGNVNHDFDDQHVGEARSKISVFSDRLDDLQRNLRSSVQVSGSTSVLLNNIANAINESMSDRYGQEGHNARIVSLLKSLEAQFIDEKTVAIKVHDSIEQLLQ